MHSVLNSVFVLGSEGGHTVHGDSALIGVVIFAALMLAMFVTMSFSRVANRHPETPARVDPHRVVHSRQSKH